MIVYILVFILFMVGLYGVITRKNIIKIVIALALMEYSMNLFFTMIGYIKNGAIPILDMKAKTPPVIVDPLPQAMILTSIVIGLATMAMLLAIAIRIYKKYKTFDISKINSLKG